MKLFIISCIAMFIAVASFSQKNNTADTSITAYLKYNCPMHTQYVSNVPAKCPVCGDNMNELSQKEIMKMEVVKLYTCPMDNVICTKPGKCPKCGMEMAELTSANKPKSD
ncbi:MAG TPA: heavy metal-binding domain-containing protein [Parafilimonas sp.]